MPLKHKRPNIIEITIPIDSQILSKLNILNSEVFNSKVKQGIENPIKT